MAISYNGTTIGTIVIRQECGELKEKYTIQIRQGNCLAVFIHVRKRTKEEIKEQPGGAYIHTLYSFFADEQHVKNIMKDNDGKVFWDEVVSIELNMYYKENYKLLKYFVQSGYKVSCFFKEEK